MFSYCNIVQFYTFEHETEEVFENVGGRAVHNRSHLMRTGKSGGEEAITPLPPSSTGPEILSLPPISTDGIHSWLGFLLLFFQGMICCYLGFLVGEGGGELPPCPSVPTVPEIFSLPPILYCTDGIHSSLGFLF